VLISEIFLTAKKAAWSDFGVDKPPQVDIAWNSIQDDAWTHVHMETEVAFSDNVNFMSKASSGSASFGNCKVPLKQAHIFSHLLIFYYPIVHDLLLA
jgi:hypothetical protein